MNRTACLTVLLSSLLAVGVSLAACGDDDAPAGGAAAAGMGGGGGRSGSGGGSGSAGAAGSSGPLYPGLYQFCNAAAEARCNDTLVANCGIASKETCIGALQNDCANGPDDLAKSFDRSKYDGDKAPPCIDAMKAAFADAQLVSAEYVTVQAACAPTFGQATPAAACEAPAKCLGAGETCKTDAVCSSGFCATVNTAEGANGRCTTTILFSASEAYCDNFK